MENNFRKICKSCLWIEGKDWIKDFCTEKNIDSICKSEECEKDLKDKFNKLIDKVKLYLKNYLQIDNVSFLFGTGSSIDIGAVSIRNFPKEIEDNLNDKEVKDLFYLIVKDIQDKFKKKDNENWIESDQNGIIRLKDYEKANKQKYEKKEIIIPLEEYVNYLLAIKYIIEKSGNFILEKKSISLELINKLINGLQIELFKLCDIENKETTHYKKDDKYYFHKKFLKALLSRPLNLKRANIFTTNYDLAFENAFDEMGITYIDGFSGFHHRTFRPEVYDYDIYYPGSTTEGKVHRIERVLKYYKLHGSITWGNSIIKNNDIYGLTEKNIDFIRNCIENNKTDLIGDLIIYPTSIKKEYTLNFPYSELFRHFAQTITQSQSVLFCIGYSFSDEHINDIIYQALSIPSFTLIIVDYNGTKNPEIKRLKEANDPRIIIFEGEYFGDFKIFCDELIPHMNEMNLREKVAETINKLYPDKSSEKGNKNDE